MYVQHGKQIILGFKISCMVDRFFPSSVRFQNHNLSCPVSGDSYRTFLLITFIASLYSNNMDWINREIVMLAVYMVMILGIIAASYLIISPSITRESHQVWQGYEQAVSLPQWKAGVSNAT